MPVSSKQIRYGGQVATTLATCASFGLRTALVGTPATTTMARAAQGARDRGVDTSQLVRRPPVIAAR